MMQKKCDTKSAMGRKYPEQVVIVTTRGPEGNTNAMAVGWVAIASSDPNMFVLGIDDEAYTYELIRETKQFVIAFPSESMTREALHVGSHHGRGRDKLAECGLATEDAEFVRAPLVSEAVANFECELVEIYKPGDCPLIIGKVVAAYEHSDPSVQRLYTIGSGYKMGGVRPEG